MQFLVIARDGTDDDALNRRMAVREAHIALTDEYLAKGDGNMIFGAAMLDEGHQMAGSVMVAEFDTREEFDAWFASEPYVTGDVWRTWEIVECRVGPSFANRS